jgi:type IV pilus assembly protein PilY1
MLRKLFFCQQWLLMLFLVLAVLKFADPAYAATGEEQLFTNVPPNVLFIFDNSNSMDEDKDGNAICSWRTDSRSVIGRKALQNIVNSYANQMRIGLMTYRLPAANQWQLHAANYFVSYEPKSYCPLDPVLDKTILDACQDYCSTGNATSQTTCTNGCKAVNSAFDETYMDDILKNPPYAASSEQRKRYCNLIYPKTQHIANYSNPGHDIYYKVPGTFYDPGFYGNQYCNFTAYSPLENAPWDSYQCYYNKTDASDASTNYSINGLGGAFQPTDDDFALGFYDYGHRLQWYYSGQTWYANSSPGDGFLHIPAADNDLIDTQKNKLLAKLATNENDQAGYMACTNTGNPNNCAYIVNAGLTPMAGSFESAYNYFMGAADYQSGVSYTSPIQDYCQKNFVVYVTDGLPSVNETGTSDTAANLMAGVNTRINNLHTVPKTIGSVTSFDVETYVIGVALTDTAQTYLDSMAVAGHTDVSGKALYATTLTDLNAALNNVFLSISAKALSFSTASVSASRVSDEDYMYEASFLPSPLSTKEPFWLGFLRQYPINPNGTINNAYLWDAGQVLKGRSAASRSIWTWKGGTATVFKTPTDGGSISATDLNVASDTLRDTVVSFIRGGELDSSYTYFGWKLGDIFHSSPRTIGTPSTDFPDVIDTHTPRAYETFRLAHDRPTSSGKRIIVVGANDGQMHAFRTSDGAEQWSFIPPNLLPNLQNIVHTTHNPIPAGLSHTYFVDGPIYPSDVWLPATAGDGTTKVSTDWYTYMVFGLRQGGSNTLWSSSSSCDSSFSATYSDTTGYIHYCGYYALDISNTLSPIYKWRIGGTSGLTSTDGSYFGQPWSKMVIGRVKYNGNETWVGFVGGGYSGVNCSVSSCSDTRGKGFYMVDMKTGNILFEFTRNDSTDMNYDLAGIPAIVDTDNDGFIDTVYMGDTGGNMWRFKFCLQSEGACTWGGDRLFATDAVHPIYTSPSVAKDSTGKIWVYFGTGNILDPTNKTVTERFYAVRDNDRSTTWTLSKLKNISTSTTIYDPNDADHKGGWYIILPNTGEKVLADPTVFRGVIYFTSYLPSTTSSLCDKSGSSNLYAVDFVTGAGKFESGVRSIDIGQGLATNVIVSLNPQGGTDIYASTSSVREGESHTKKLTTPSIADLNRTNLLFWRDMRVQ